MQTDQVIINVVEDLWVRRFKVDGRTYRIFKRVPSKDAPYQLRCEIYGRLLKRSLGTNNGATAEAIAAKLIRKARERRWDAIDLTRARAINAVATIGEIIAAYRNLTTGLIAERTQRDNISSLRLLVKRGLEREMDETSIDALRTSELTSKLIRDFKRVSARDGSNAEDPESAKRSVNSRLRQARSVFTKEMLTAYYADRELLLTDLKPFLTEPGFRAAKAKYVPPDDQLMQQMFSSLRQFRRADPFAYLAWLLSYGCGLRRGEIAQLKWSTLVEKDGAGILQLSARQKNKRQADVPVPRRVWALLKVFRKHATGEYVLPSPREDSKLRGQNIFRRVYSWMRSHGWTRRKCLHEMRKYLGYRVRQQFGLEAAQGMLRHENQSTTEDYYSGAAEPKTASVDLGI